MDFQTLLFFYLFLTMGGLAILFLGQGKEKANTHLDPQQLTSCEYCLTPYLQDPSTTITTCPRCGSKNKIRR